MPLLTPHVPQGLIELMKNLTKDVLRDKPTNIYEFAVVHFEKLIEQRDGSLHKNYEQFVAFEALFEGQQRFAVPASYGFICQRPKATSQPDGQSKKSKYAMESINEEEVLNENLYSDERYQNAVYVIQRYYRRYVAMKKKSTSSTLTATTAAIIIQRTMRRLFSNKIKLKTSADSAKRDAQQDDADNVSEAASYTSSSTIQMLAESQEGRENQLSGRGLVSDGVASSDGATEFKEQMTAAQQNSPIAEEGDSEVPPTGMDKKSIDDGNDISNPLHQDKATTLDERTTSLDDTSTAHIGKLSTVIGSNDQQNSLHTNNVEIESKCSDPTTAVAVGIYSYPLNFPQSLGATPETLPATSPRHETQDEFMVRLLQDNAQYAVGNMAFPYQGDLHVKKFDPDNGESLKIYDRFYHDRDDPDFSDSLNESTMERDSLENDDLEADSLDSNENAVHMSGIAKREARQDDGSLYEDTDELQEEEEAPEQEPRRLIELERAPTYLYGIHPTRTPIVERKNFKNRRSAESRTMDNDDDDDDDSKETASSLSMVNAVMEEKSPEESLESRESTSEESSVTEIENTTGMTKGDSTDKNLRNNGKQTNDSQDEVTNTHRYKATLEEEPPFELGVDRDEGVDSMNMKNERSLVQQGETLQIDESQSKSLDKQNTAIGHLDGTQIADVPKLINISEVENALEQTAPILNVTSSNQGHTPASESGSHILSFKEDQSIPSIQNTDSFLNEMETASVPLKATKEYEKRTLDGNAAPPFSDKDSPATETNQSDSVISSVGNNGVEKLDTSSTEDLLMITDPAGEDSSPRSELDPLTSTKLESKSNKCQPESELHSGVLELESEESNSEEYLKGSAKSLELVLKSLKNETKNKEEVLGLSTEASDKFSLQNDSNGQTEHAEKSELGSAVDEHKRSEDGSEGLVDRDTVPTTDLSEGNVAEDSEVIAKDKTLMNAEETVLKDFGDKPNEIRSEKSSRDEIRLERPPWSSTSMHSVLHDHEVESQLKELKSLNDIQPDLREELKLHSEATQQQLHDIPATLIHDNNNNEANTLLEEQALSEESVKSLEQVLKGHKNNSEATNTTLETGMKHRIPNTESDPDELEKSSDRQKRSLNTNTGPPFSDAESLVSLDEQEATNLPVGFDIGAIGKAGVQGILPVTPGDVYHKKISPATENKESIDSGLDLTTDGLLDSSSNPRPDSSNSIRQEKHDQQVYNHVNNTNVEANKRKSEDLSFEAQTIVEDQVVSEESLKDSAKSLEKILKNLKNDTKNKDFFFKNEDDKTKPFVDRDSENIQDPGQHFEITSKTRNTEIGFKNEIQSSDLSEGQPNLEALESVPVSQTIKHEAVVKNHSEDKIEVVRNTVKANEQIVSVGNLETLNRSNISSESSGEATDNTLVSEEIIIHSGEKRVEESKKLQNERSVDESENYSATDLKASETFTDDSSSIKKNLEKTGKAVEVLAETYPHHEPLKSPNSENNLKSQAIESSGESKKLSEESDISSSSVNEENHLSLGESKNKVVSEIAAFYKISSTSKNNDVQNLAEVKDYQSSTLAGNVEESKKKTILEPKDESSGSNLEENYMNSPERALEGLEIHSIVQAKIEPALNKSLDDDTAANILSLNELVSDGSGKFVENTLEKDSKYLEEHQSQGPMSNARYEEPQDRAPTDGVSYKNVVDRGEKMMSKETRKVPDEEEKNYSKIDNKPSPGAPEISTQVISSEGLNERATGKNEQGVEKPVVNVDKLEEASLESPAIAGNKARLNESFETFNETQSVSKLGVEFFNSNSVSEPVALLNDLESAEHEDTIKQIDDIKPTAVPESSYLKYLTLIDFNGNSENEEENTKSLGSKVEQKENKDENLKDETKSYDSLDSSKTVKEEGDNDLGTEKPVRITSKDEIESSEDIDINTNSKTTLEEEHDENKRINLEDKEHNDFETKSTLPHQLSRALSFPVYNSKSKIKDLNEMDQNLGEDDIFRKDIEEPKTFNESKPKIQENQDDGELFDYFGKTIEFDEDINPSEPPEPPRLDPLSIIRQFSSGDVRSKLPKVDEETNDEEDAFERGEVFVSKEDLRQINEVLDSVELQQIKVEPEERVQLREESLQILNETSSTVDFEVLSKISANLQNGGLEPKILHPEKVNEDQRETKPLSLEQKVKEETDDMKDSIKAPEMKEMDSFELGNVSEKQAVQMITNKIGDQPENEPQKNFKDSGETKGISSDPKFMTSKSNDHHTKAYEMPLNKAQEHEKQLPHETETTIKSESILGATGPALLLEQKTRAVDEVKESVENEETSESIKGLGDNKLYSVPPFQDGKLEDRDKELTSNKLARGTLVPDGIENEVHITASKVKELDTAKGENTKQDIKSTSESLRIKEECLKENKEETLKTEPELTGGSESLQINETSCEESHNTSADFSSIGQDLDFFEYTIDYLKSATVQLSAMDKLFDENLTEKSKKGDQPDKSVQNEAATVIQSAIRGYQVRKALNKKDVAPELQENDLQALIDNETKNKPYSEQVLNHAAVIIQSAVRGFQVRKASKRDSDVETVEVNRVDSNDKHQPIVLIPQEKSLSHPIVVVHLAEDLPEEEEEHEGEKHTTAEPEDVNRENEQCEESNVTEVLNQTDARNGTLTFCDKQNEEREVIEEDCLKHDQQTVFSTKNENLTEEPCKDVQKFSYDQTCEEETRHSSSGKTRNSIDLRPSKTPSAPVHRPHLPKSKKNQFGRKGRSMSLLEQNIPNIFDLEAIKKELLSKRVKITPHTGGKKKDANSRDHRIMTNKEKSQRTLDKASDVAKKTKEVEEFTPDRNEHCNELKGNDSKPFELSNIARNEETDDNKQDNGFKPEIMQIFEGPMKKQSDEENHVELSSGDQEEENFTDELKNGTQNTDVQNNSATIIQKTFRGYRTRRSISASGMRQTRNQLNGKEEDSDSSRLARKLSESKLEQKEEEPQTLSLFDSLKKEVDEFRNSVIDKSATTIQKTFRGYKARKDLKVEKEDSELPAKLVPMKTEDVMEVSSKIEDLINDTEKEDDTLSDVAKEGRHTASLIKTLSKDSKDHAETYKLDKTEVNDEESITYDSFDVEGYQNAALDKSATKIQKTYRGYKTRKDLKPKSIKEEIEKTSLSDENSDEMVVRKETLLEESNPNSFVEKTNDALEMINHAEEDQKLIKEDDTMIKALEKMIIKHKELRKSPRHESEHSQDQFKDKPQNEVRNEALNESATTIQKTYKGYKTRKDIKTVKYHSQKPKTENSSSNEESTKSSMQLEDSFQTISTGDKQKEVENIVRPASAGPLLEAAASTIQKAYRDYHTKKDISHSLAPIKSYSHGSKRGNALKEAAENSDESSIFIGADTSFDLSDTESFDIKSDLKSTDSPQTPVNCEEKHEAIPPKVSRSSTLAMILHSENHDLENDSAYPIADSKENSLYIPKGIIRKRSIIEPAAPPLEDVLQAFEISNVEQKPQWYVGDELIVPSDGSNTPTAPSSSFPIPLVSSIRFEQSNNIDARVEYLTSDLQLIPSSVSSAVVSTSSLLLDKHTEMHDEINPKQLSNYSRPVSAKEEHRESEENQETEKVVKNEDQRTQDIAAFSPDTEETLEFNGTDPFSPRVGVEGLTGTEDVAAKSTVTDLCKDCADGIHQTDVALLGHKCNEEISIDIIKTEDANVEDTKADVDSSENHFDEIKHFVLAEEKNTNIRDSDDNEAEIRGHKILTEQNHGDQMSNDPSDDGKIDHTLKVTIEVNDQNHEETVKSVAEPPPILFVPPSSEEETSDKEAGQHENESGAQVIEKCQKEEDVNVLNESQEGSKSIDDKSEESSKSCQNLNDSKVLKVDDEASQMKANSNEGSFDIEANVERNATSKMNEETDQRAEVTEERRSDEEITNEEINKVQTSAATSKTDIETYISRMSDDVTKVEPIINDEKIEETEPKPVTEELSEKEKVIDDDVKQELHDSNHLSSEKTKNYGNQHEDDKSIEEIENVIKDDSEKIETLDKTTSDINTELEQSLDILNSKQIEDHSESKSEQDSIKDNLKFEDNFEDNIEASEENVASIDSEIIPRKQTALSSEQVNEEIEIHSKKIEDTPIDSVKPTLSQTIEHSKEQDLKNIDECSQEKSDEVKSSKEITKCDVGSLEEASKEERDFETKTDEDKIENEIEEILLVKEEACSDNTLTEEVKNLSSQEEKSTSDSIKEEVDLERNSIGEIEIDSKAEENIRFEEKKCFDASAEEAAISSEKNKVDSKIEEHMPSEENKSSEDEGKASGEDDNLNLTDLKAVKQESRNTETAQDMSTIDEPIHPTSLKDELMIELIEQPELNIKEESLKDEEHQTSKHCSQAEQKDETPNLQEDLEIASKLLEAIISDNQNNDKLESHSNDPKQNDVLLRTETDKIETLDAPANKSFENQESPSEADREIQKKLDKLIEDSSSQIEDTTNSIQPQDLPTENCLEEVVEVPCIKKLVPRTPLSAISDQDESELESTTTKADSTTTTQAYDETSENDAIDMPTSIPDNLEAVAEKLRENEAMVARMHQRRASEQKVSTDSIDPSPAFDELICEPIKPMQELQNSSSTEIEDEIVLQKLQRDDTTRESSAQSESVVFGGSTSQSIESHDTFNENLDFKSFHRMNTISTDCSIYKPTSLLFKSVTIDDTVKYIDPEKSTEESTGSFHMDDATSADVRKKIMAYSVSEADSDYYESSDRNGYPRDDFNISTAMDTFPSTDTDTTIVSAATKIQAGARGFLTRRRLRRASMGTKSSLTEETKMSFGNDAIGESLDRLVEEEVASRVPKVQYHRQTGVNSLPSALGHSDEETYIVHLSPTREEIHANEHESCDLKLAELSAMANTSPHGELPSSIDGPREVPQLYTSSEDDVNGGIDATLAARRLTLQRGDAMRNDSTPDDENGKQVDAAKSIRATTDPVLIQQRTMVELTTTSTMTVSTERRHYSDEATNIKMEKIRWFAMRQNSMPVQIDSEVFRVLPKHMRKRIKSAEGEKKKRIRLPRD